MARPSKFKPKTLFVSPLSIGQRLAALRKSKGYTQESLAQFMGISRKQITDYETDRVHMNDDMIVRFAVTLKVSSDTLLGLKDFDFPIESHNVRFTKRLRELEQLPEQRKRSVLKILDELLKQEHS